jgi:hypothetical protein
VSETKSALIDRLREFFCTHKYDTHSASSLQVFEFDLCNGSNWEEIYIALNTLTAEGLLTKTQDQEDGEFSYSLADTPGPCAVSCSEIMKLQVEVARYKRLYHVVIGTTIAWDEMIARGEKPEWTQDLQDNLEAVLIKTSDDKPCTCGSGAHPRPCQKHPNRYAEHLDELGEESKTDWIERCKELEVENTSLKNKLSETETKLFRCLK